MFQDRIWIFDGAIGTELYERGHYINRPFEELNLSAPDAVLSVHQAYLEAGSEVITTNTFGITKPQLKRFDIADQQDKILKAALAIAAKAKRAVKDPQAVRIGLSMGPLGLLMEPLGPTSVDEVREEYRGIANAVYDEGPHDFYNLETFSNVRELEQAVMGIRDIDKKRGILASLTVKSAQKEILEEFAELIAKRDDVNAIGLNCSEGPNDLLTSLKYLHELTTKPIICQPNAGIPRQLNGRYFYMTSPDYLAKFAKRFVEAGASGVGGCCGTGPAHISAIRTSIRMMNAKQGASREGASPKIVLTRSKDMPRRRGWSDRKFSRIGEVLRSGQKFLTVEVTSPKGVSLEKFLSGMDVLAKAGVKFVNVPDGARASTRVSSLHLAAYMEREKNYGIHVLPHFTTRDRNLIALQADLLGAYVNGVRDLLLITGDPPKIASSKDATAVYDVDAIGLTYLVDCLNRGCTPRGESLGSKTDFGIGVASNPTAINMEVELNRWKYKVESGADFAVTQPIFDPESFFRWRDSLKSRYKPHIIGLWPFISMRNAEFMANEVPGVFVPPWILEEMAKAGEDIEEAKKRGIDIACRVIEKLMPHCEGFAVSAPLNKVEVALEVIKNTNLVGATQPAVQTDMGK